MSVPEFSRPVDARQLSAKAVSIEASAHERKALARRFGIVAIQQLQATVKLVRAGAAIMAGAEDLIEKPINDTELIAAINRCLAQASERLSVGQSTENLEQRFSKLTPREREIFDLVAEGYTSHAISIRLAISSRTVESLRVQIMEKMQAESIAILVRQSIRLGRLKP